MKPSWHSLWLLLLAPLGIVVIYAILGQLAQDRSELEQRIIKTKFGMVQVIGGEVFLEPDSTKDHSLGFFVKKPKKKPGVELCLMIFPTGSLW